MAVIQILLDSKPGPLPLKGTFQPQADLVPCVYLTGTAQTNTPSTIQIELAILDKDGKDAGGTSVVVFSNEPNQHKTLLALLTNQKPWNFGETYTYSITAASPGAFADANDFFSLTILY
jgi:hypothetical protein